MKDDSISHDVHANKKSIMYDRGTLKVVILACFIIIMAVVLTGGISYFITQNAVVDKLKNRDFVYIIESIRAKIDGRIERAKETSLILAKDPTVLEWIAGGEKDERLGEYAKAQINDIAQGYDYANTFVVSAVTGNYWAEGPKLIHVMSVTDPNDKWFYDALTSGKFIDLNIDYNSGRGDTFVFLNALMGDVNNPVAVAGVGLSLMDIAKEFQSYKIAQTSNLWLVDNKGKIYLSDNINHNGKYLNDYIPPDVVARIVQDIDELSAKPKVIEYSDLNGGIIDLAYQSTKSTNWKLVLQIPRNESIAMLSSIKLNATIASLVSLILIVFIFYMVSQRIANPFKRAVLLSQEMEKQVRERTKELAAKNQKIIDSIDYAKRLQEAVLPPMNELSVIFREHFIIWRPRDMVGGDFYWVRKIDSQRSLVAIADCTGHGVPGAFMTMAVNSILNNIVNKDYDNPANIVAELNRQVKETLHRNDPGRIVDDGLDIGVCYIEGSRRLIFAGAKIPLYVKRGDRVHVIKGDNRSIGYRRSKNEQEFTNHVWEIEKDDVFYLTTDGYIDQNGGEKDFPLSRKRFIQTISHSGEKSLAQQRNIMETVLREYMGDETQRDDITVLGFKL